MAEPRCRAAGGCQSGLSGQAGESPTRIAKDRVVLVYRDSRRGIERLDMATGDEDVFPAVVVEVSDRGE